MRTDSSPSIDSKGSLHEKQGGKTPVEEEGKGSTAERPVLDVPDIWGDTSKYFRQKNCMKKSKTHCGHMMAIEFRGRTIAVKIRLEMVMKIISTVVEFLNV